MKDNIVIFGPTASGKSALALELARRLDGEIINMDSMQIYKGMDILTAKPSREEKSRVPHHLYDLVYPHEEFSVHDYKELALKTISDIRSRGKLPILVGGTGLYLSSLYYDYGFRERDSLKRKCLENLLDTEGIQALQELARQNYPHYMEEIDLENPHRLIRLLESGKIDRVKRKSDLRLKVFVPDWPRDELNRRIESRIDVMLSQGLLDEVASLFALYGEREYLPALRGIGYKEYLPYLKGLMELDEARVRHLIATRQYAKRQRTWARNQYDDTIFLPGELSMEEKIEFIEREWR